MKITLILTTVDKKIDVIRLFNSIKMQLSDSHFFEIVFIDQNFIFSNDDLILFETNNITINHIVLNEVVSLSKARNIGLSNAVLDSDVICFPDDDCWYSSEFFSSLNMAFDLYESDIICTNVYDPLNIKRYGQRPFKRTQVNFSNVFSLPISVGIFIKTKSYLSEGFQFDQNYGVGTKFGSGEETKFVIDHLLKGKKAFYLGDLFVYHPVESYQIQDVEKFYNYGLGFGSLHRYIFSKFIFLSLPNFISVVLRSFIGHLVSKNKISSDVYKSRFKGLIKGFFS